MNAKCSITFSLVVGLASVCSIASSENIDPQKATEAPALRIEEIAAECRHDNGIPYKLVDRPCFDRLTRYFKPEPIWEMAGGMYYYVHSNLRYAWPAINPRGSSSYLKFTKADYLLQEVPTWSDIFDGRILERQDIVKSVFEDDACRALAEKGGIRPELAERCQARELFKYATYLDACLTGFRRSRELMHTPSERSVYEMTMDEIRRRDALNGETEYPDPALLGHGETSPDLVTELGITEFHMHSSWITRMCIALPGMAFNGDLQPVWQGELSDSGFFEKIEIGKFIEQGHDAALGIAARSGDAWAIQSYISPGLSTDPDYWNTLREINPLLVHRWLATDMVGGSLSDEEQLWHVVKAYSIGRELVEGLSLKDYVEQVEQYDIREADISDPMLKQVLSGEDGPAENGAQSSVEDMAVSRIADGELLKYPRQLAP